MFKRNVLAVSMTLAALCSAQAALADINGGGATLPQALYQTSGVLTAGFAPYIGVGSGNGKSAFLNNDYTKFVAGVTNKNVHWAGSDSKLSATELSTYASAKQPAWGKLIQVPSVGTAVAIPFNKSGTAAVDLSVSELCGVFSGRIADWSGISGSGRTGAIKIVYRSESSGTTELFTRFLNAKCTTEAGTFAVTPIFANSYSLGLTPLVGAVAATGSQGVMTSLGATDGGITYMSPDFAAPTLAGLDDATKVARVGKNVATNTLGVSPAAANVSAAIGAVPVPAAAVRSNPDAWVPVFGPDNTAGVQPYPTTGYPILGFTNLIFSQCYADATQTTQVRDFFTKHYGASSNNDAAITANAFVPLPTAWKATVRASFLTASSALSIGNTNVCNGIGRPL
ncbi:MULTISPECIES: substrate-binding domain-containing protein [Pseudomonas]|uniref:Phosphate-binding protein PstS n=1 Tax=Pseudomonas fluorescens TaxID=294 RepID=A0A4Y9T8U9_PSEFL|nr:MULTISPECIES: substrate-binding domain-containing protein [Pseudomonas]CRM88164.1 Phosphate-binding protein [Pseudomonas sp. 22 E 5]MCX9152919.1 substrate-binding domain-containing protein [Pseudomonas sp. TB1-B1]TFW40418.1 protein disulfide reductase [Pseudomonas fluorescens]TKJ57003.1 protein disulfide reductase [Pseudomonas sp. CFBP13506]CRM45100.1 Phosphate-binding protein [Pseudomonas sp. 31 E 5]